MAVPRASYQESLCLHSRPLCPSKAHVICHPRTERWLLNMDSLLVLYDQILWRGDILWKAKQRTIRSCILQQGFDTRKGRNGRTKTLRNGTNRHNVIGFPLHVQDKKCSVRVNQTGMKDRDARKKQSMLVVCLSMKSYKSTHHHRATKIQYTVSSFVFLCIFGLTDP